jgi:hypothetical protein
LASYFKNIYFIKNKKAFRFKTERTAQFDFPNGQSRNVKYFSWQPSYDEQKVSMDPNNPYGIPYGPGFYENNDDIEYDLIYRVN